MRYLCLLFMLTGCPEPIFTPVEVKVPVPVPVPCKIEEPAAPQWPTLALKPDAGMFEKTKAALAELELRRGYEELLLAAVRSCR